MPKLVYTALISLDGYIEDPSGSFDWAMPDAEVHAAANDLASTVGIELYGRRMYETMAVWQTIEAGPGVADEEVAFADAWRSHEKVVYSRTLDEVTTDRTRLERELDPGAVRALVDASDHDVSISGPGLASHAFAAGLVDDVHLFVFPVIVGGGKPGLPRDVRLDLELVGERRFGNGVVHLHHRTARPG
jgi:dihydrofolate reductase